MTDSLNDAQSRLSQRWQPAAQLHAIQARALLLATIRQFFAARQILEVDTPILSKHATTDPYIDSIKTNDGFLQTSPEFAMKRLLCAGAGSIYQIAKAFRHQESGRYHNPEFSMLEWYRVGFTHTDLMREVDEFLGATLGTEAADVISYQQLFKDSLALDPLDCSDADLSDNIQQQQLSISHQIELSRDDRLNLLFTHCIEPRLGLHKPVIVYGFPASQSALARINQQDPRIADRFEVYFRGIELANGFYELADADEQLQRFYSDNKARRSKGLAEMPIDRHLIDALAAGLPNCAGVALGIDRLLMLKLGAKHIDEVLCFPFSCA